MAGTRIRHKLTEPSDWEEAGSGGHEDENDVSDNNFMATFTEAAESMIFRSNNTARAKQETY